MKLKMPEMPPGQLVAALRSYNLLPAIVFMPSRRRCDEAATEAALTTRNFSNNERQEKRREMLREFTSANPEIRGHRHWQTIIRGGVASHHAGHIPAWKLAIEKLMVAGTLDAIFATTTVAAGVDFPARTVVVINADTRSNQGWRALTASELQQMTGRAGRRGKDNVGFIVVAPSLHQDPEKIAKLLSSHPDPLQSQFRATYSTLLNLLDAYESFAQVREIAEKSFAFREITHHIIGLEKKRDEIEKKVKDKLINRGVNATIDTARGLERLVSARMRLLEKLPQTRAEVRHNWLSEVVQMGRIVSIGRSGKKFMLVLSRYGAKVTGMREDGRGTAFALEKVNRVWTKKYPLREEFWDVAFGEIHSGANPPLEEPRLRDEKHVEDDAVNLINDLIEKLAPQSLKSEEREAFTQALWSTMEETFEIERIERDIENLHEEIWKPFERCARVLNHFGYLDLATERVTERGRWLADVHVDRTLLVGEAVRHGLFTKLEPANAAALMAALAADEDRDYGELYLDEDLLNALSEFEEIAFEVSTVEWKQGVDPAPEMNFSAAAATALWANGATWEALVHETRAEEGDLFRLLSRAGEALLQVAGLQKAQPEAARIASMAADAILREPVR
jgi:superfamily II RNA helicase